MAHEIAPSCCSVPFWMSDGHYDNRLEDGKSWWCPACGENRIFTKKTTLETKLRRANSATEHARKMNDMEEETNQSLRYQLRSQKSATTRIKNKLKALESSK